MQYYGDIELVDSQIINCKIEAVNTLPTFILSDIQRVVYNLTDNNLYYNNGSAWVALQAASQNAQPLIITLGENWINDDYSFNPTPFNELYAISGLTSESTLFDVIEQLDAAIEENSDISLGDLSDVSVESSPTDNEVLFFNTITEKYVSSKWMYYYEELSPMTTHVVGHGLGQQYCTVAVINASTNLEILDITSISYDSVSQLTVTLPTEQAAIILVSCIPVINE